MEIFELFAQEQRPLSLAEIGGRLSYPMASTSALLKSLQAVDYLSYDRLARTYSPTIRVAMLGDWVRADVLRNGALVEVMQNLAHQLDATIYLGMQNDLQAQYIHTEQPGRMLRHYLPPGKLRPLTNSAAGIMLLACLSDVQIAKLLTRLEGQRMVEVEPAEIWDRIKAARQQGYASNRGLTKDIAAVAVPLPYRTNGRPLVLCLGVLESRFDAEGEALISALQSSMTQLS